MKLEVGPVIILVLRFPPLCGFIFRIKAMYKHIQVDYLVPLVTQYINKGHMCCHSSQTAAGKPALHTSGMSWNNRKRVIVTCNWDYIWKGSVIWGIKQKKMGNAAFYPEHATPEYTRKKLGRDHATLVNWVRRHHISIVKNCSNFNYTMTILGFFSLSVIPLYFKN